MPEKQYELEDEYDELGFIYWPPSPAGSPKQDSVIKEAEAEQDEHQVGPKPNISCLQYPLNFNLSFLSQLFALQSI